MEPYCIKVQTKTEGEFATESTRFVYIGEFTNEQANQIVETASIRAMFKQPNEAMPALYSMLNTFAAAMTESHPIWTRSFEWDKAYDYLRTITSGEQICELMGIGWNHLAQNTVKFSFEQGKLSFSLIPLDHPAVLQCNDGNPMRGFNYAQGFVDKAYLEWAEFHAYRVIVPQWFTHSVWTYKGIYQGDIVTERISYIVTFSAVPLSEMINTIVIEARETRKRLKEFPVETFVNESQIETSRGQVTVFEFDIDRHIDCLLCECLKESKDVRRVNRLCGQPTPISSPNQLMVTEQAAVSVAAIETDVPQVQHVDEKGSEGEYLKEKSTVPDWIKTDEGKQWCYIQYEEMKRSKGDIAAQLKKVGIRIANDTVKNHAERWQQKRGLPPLKKRNSGRKPEKI
jgi:hypothetical protein